MKKLLTRLFRKTLPVAPKLNHLNLDEFLDVLFLSLPYINLIKRIKSEYDSQTDGNLFRFVVNGILSEMDKADIYKIFSILLKLPLNDIQKMEISEMISKIPSIISDNNLLELYFIAKRIGVVE